MGVAGSVIRIEGGLPENSDSISNIWTLRMNWGLCSGAEREFPNIDILKTSSAEEENILGNIASSAEEENILGNIASSAEEENILGNIALSLHRLCYFFAES